MRRLSAALGLLALACSAAVSSEAAAHAQLRTTAPAAGEVLQEPPTAIRLNFSEPVAPLALRWIAPDGRDLALPGPPRAAGAALTLPAPNGLGPGTHLISWRVMSLDGHPVGGTFAFSIGAPSAAPAAGETQFRQASAWLAATGRYALTLLLAVGVGGAVFTALVDRRRQAPGWTRALARVAAVGAIPMSGLAFGLYGADLLGEGIRALPSVAPWATAAGTSFLATSVLAASAGLAAAIAPSFRRRAPALVALGLASLSYALSGHVSTASPAWLALPAMTLHAAALIYWLGALVPLAAVASTGTEGLAQLLHRFSRLAVPAIIVLLATGGLLAVIEVGTFSAIVQSDYGRVLLLKLFGVAVLLSLAAINRFRLTPAIATGGSARPLVRNVGLEILVGLIVVGLATGFRLTPPPRALSAAAPAEVYVHFHQARAMADVTLRPGTSGPNAVEIGVYDGDFGRLDPLEVEIAFVPLDRGLETIAARARRGAEGLWHVENVFIPFDGAWTVKVGILISDFEKATLSGEIELRDSGEASQ